MNIAKVGEFYAREWNDAYPPAALHDLEKKDAESIKRYMTSRIRPLTSEEFKDARKVVYDGYEWLRYAGFIKASRVYSVYVEPITRRYVFQVGEWLDDTQPTFVDAMAVSVQKCIHDTAVCYESYFEK